MATSCTTAVQEAGQHRERRKRTWRRPEGTKAQRYKGLNTGQGTWYEDRTPSVRPEQHAHAVLVAVVHDERRPDAVELFDVEVQVVEVEVAGVSACVDLHVGRCQAEEPEGNRHLHEPGFVGIPGLDEQR